MKLSEHWRMLQKMPDGPLPEGSIHYKADKDEAYSVVQGDEEVIYCDGSNHGREWAENALMWPAILFYCMFYGFANVAREMIKDGMAEKLRCLAIRIICHSRGIFGLGLAIKLHDLGFTIREVVLMGTPKPGGWWFYRACRKRNIKVSMYQIVECEEGKGDPVPLLPPWGRHYFTSVERIPNSDGIEGTKEIHTSFGHYFEKRGE